MNTVKFHDRRLSKLVNKKIKVLEIRLRISESTGIRIGPFQDWTQNCISYLVQEAYWRSN